MIQAYINLEKDASTITLQGYTQEVVCELAILVKGVLGKIKHRQDELGNIKSFDEHMEYLVSEIKGLGIDIE